MRIAILDDYQRIALQYADWDTLGRDCDIQVFARNLSSIDEAADALADFDVLCLMRERMPLPRELIERLPRLKLVIVTGARTRTIDLEAAAKHGVTVCHTHPGESQYATPELAWGLILSCARSIPEEHRHVREGRWQETIGLSLGGKTLGLLGLGKLGSRMVPIARAFGMDVVAWSQNLTEEKAASLQAKRVEKDELFRISDVVSIHLILSERTRGLVGAHEFGLMKPSAILVNTSRGPIIDEEAMIQALQTRRIRAAGLDVFDQEPLPPDHPLRTIPNAVLTPHLGYVTEGAYRAFFEDTVEGIAAWRAGNPVRVLAAPA
ncbi:hydroxyacid dehydrogenase [Microvirga sp. KLBC 81]|uniref:D-2-hydroxyacid dehydrogenase family protein n=1 Tax=Microvirga sp. KLBC 81 TaxID=1862707 RepID=UPI000D51A1B6|nr:D-2-hydroxyacid dehydrogenase family protein [Microvirga sp. KLBC 81]PVE24897.1 hydroxyacid dehydrogenase [Microvirga sp. KLBC 81]